MALQDYDPPIGAVVNGWRVRIVDEEYDQIFEEFFTMEEKHNVKDSIRGTLDRLAHEQDWAESYLEGLFRFFDNWDGESLVRDVVEGDHLTIFISQVRLKVIRELKLVGHEWVPQMTKSAGKQ